jgi:hypothetical protein
MDTHMIGKVHVIFVYQIVSRKLVSIVLENTMYCVCFFFFLTRVRKHQSKAKTKLM